MKTEIRKQKKIRRHRKIRARVKGTSIIPRLYVFRSLNYIYAQLIDDDKGKTLVSSSEKDIKGKTKSDETKDLSGKIEKAYKVGQSIAKKAEENKIKKVVFDRAGYKYHGRVKALAEGARQSGLEF
ncbi:MAG: 50S ribosomal protein L18 [Patescibacteria group bacterium]|nr:50S ribosomal protein L18 [Patescibacteria group bacterium]